MATKQGDLALLGDPVAQDLLQLESGQDQSESEMVGDVPAAVEFGRVAAAPVNTLTQQTHCCQEISVCF